MWLGEVADKEGEEDGDKKTDSSRRRWGGILLARVWLACELGVFVERCVAYVLLLFISVANICNTFSTFSCRPFFLAVLHAVLLPRHER